MKRNAAERYHRALRVYYETSGEAWASVLEHLGEVDSRILSLWKPITNVLLKPITNVFGRTPADLGVDVRVDRGPVAEALPS